MDSKVVHPWEGERPFTPAEFEERGRYLSQYRFTEETVKRRKELEKKIHKLKEEFDKEEMLIRRDYTLAHSYKLWVCRVFILPFPCEADRLRAMEFNIPANDSSLRTVSLNSSNCQSRYSYVFGHWQWNRQTDISIALLICDLNEHTTIEPSGGYIPKKVPVVWN